MRFNFFLDHLLMGKAMVGTARRHRAAALTEERAPAQCLMWTHGSDTGRAMTQTHSLSALVLGTVRSGPGPLIFITLHGA